MYSRAGFANEKNVVKLTIALQKVPTNLRGRLTLGRYRGDLPECRPHMAHLRDNKSSGTCKDKRCENERDT